MKPLKGAIKTAIEFKEQRGIEVLKLASGFASWKTDKISNANAPLFLYSVEQENSGAFINTKLRLVETEPEINSVLFLHLQRRMAVGIKDESFEEFEDPTEETLWELCNASSGGMLTISLNGPKGGQGLRRNPRTPCKT